ncbi:DUF6056 family protein [Seonamhaeicola maritimus]|uniref:DUF6056 family protein n=1 Tax=Seonamhaeicola maritimus TaxID=2591822 RepID=UPI0024957FE1|nr:DUF6056 family protein [Seonamhaeicola maritimus]
MLLENRIIQKLMIRVNYLIRSDNFIILMGVLTILPFLAISFFNNPIADDFCYNVKSQDLSYWKSQLFIYNNWNGRYFTTAILTMKYLVYGGFLTYKIIPIIILIFLFYSIYKLSSLLFVNIQRKDCVLIGFYFVVMYLIQMPNVSEGIYWLAGTINYQLANILTIMFLYFLIKLILTNKRKYMVISVLFSSFVIGLNEISMLTIDFLIVVIFIFKFFKDKKFSLNMFILIIFCLIFSTIVISSPGIAFRATNYEDRYQIIAVKQSLFAIKRQLENWLPFIIMFSFVFYDYFNKRVDKKTSINFQLNPFLITGFIFCILFIGFFTVYWATGQDLATRTLNTMYFYFLLGFVFLSLNILFRLKKMDKNFISVSKWGKYFIIVLIFIYLKGDKSHLNNLRTVYIDLFSGKAYNYNLELKKRYELMKISNSDTISLPKVKYKPKTIFVSDLMEDSDHWINKCFVEHLKLNKVILLKD